MECSSIGGSVDYSPDEEDALNNILSDVAGVEDDYALLDDFNSTVIPDENTSGLPFVDKNNTIKCSDRIVDTSKPFSGRDIVYVHGLQKAVLDGYTEHPPKFMAHWPEDKEAFYKGGEYHNATESYWAEHIKRELGSITNPTNSYLIVTWPTKQHVPSAVNAVLTQVQDARNRDNAGVVFSQSGQTHNQCFGDNGIVFVSHSTGGLVVSSMFGYIEINKNTTHSVYHIPQDLYNKIDAHIAIDAAFRGSPIATAGLMTHSFNSTFHRMGDAIRRIFGDTVLSGAAGFDPYDTIMADLGLQSYVNHYRTIMSQARKPTFLTVGASTGKPQNESRTGAGVLIRGYGDGVLSSWSQTNATTKRPKYFVKKRWLLKDLDAEAVKRMNIYYQGKVNINPFKFKYFVSPYTSPSGMIQYNSILSVADGRSYGQNFYPILQTSGNHFDNVDDIHLNGNNYYEPKFYTKNNNEETNVLIDSSLYTSGYLSPSYALLPIIEQARKTWGFNFFKLTWVLKEIKIFGRTIKLHVPKITWHYYEFILWQREYELLDGYQNKKGADYLYQYLLRP